MKQIKAERSYWVNKTQILADSWQEIEEDGVKWLVFIINEEIVMAVRKSDLFDLRIELPLGINMYQDTIACKHWERHYPKPITDTGRMVFGK